MPGWRPERGTRAAGRGLRGLAERGSGAVAALQAMRPGLIGSCVAGAWLGNALYAFGEPGGAFQFWSSGLVGLAMIAFTLVHGGRCYGRDGILLFVLIVFALGWLFEALSIATGVPFGKYHYTDIMAPFIGHVPVFVMPAYCVMGYVCWSLSRLMWSRRDGDGELAQPVRVATTAAVLMVIWDLSMDPLRATVEGRWVWIDGGPYFGVPLLNFAGWFIVTFAMFAIFAAAHARRWTSQVETPGPRQRFWVAVPLIYLAFPVEYMLNGVLATPGPQAPVWAGMTTADIHVRVAIVTLLTMVPLAALGCHKALTLPVEALPRDCRRAKVRGNEQSAA